MLERKIVFKCRTAVADPIFHYYPAIKYLHTHTRTQGGDSNKTPIIIFVYIHLVLADKCNGWRATNHSQNTRIDHFFHLILKQQQQKPKKLWLNVENFFCSRYMNYSMRSKFICGMMRLFVCVCVRVLSERYFLYQTVNLQAANRLLRYFRESEGNCVSRVRFM